jgi:hypothetical protein
VYGNVLVMATLISLRPEDLRGPAGVLALLGVGVSTVVAHVVGDAVARRIREGWPSGRPTLRDELQDALPIGTAALLPALILVPAWAGDADPRVSLVVALAVTDIRLALIGSAVEWYSGERSSRRLVLAGAGLAVAAAVAAVLKWWSTH